MEYLDLLPGISKLKKNICLGKGDLSCKIFGYHLFPQGHLFHFYSLFPLIVFLAHFSIFSVLPSLHTVSSSVSYNGPHYLAGQPVEVAHTLQLAVMNLALVSCTALLDERQPSRS